MNKKPLLERLLCKPHEWEEIKGTRHIYNGYSKGADFKCTKCGRTRFFDIFDIPKNTYIFKEYRKGKISDGDHTFDELYYHRMVLFAVICDTYRELAWKSWKHHDGTMYEDYFIVGIDTPRGQYSYHYHKDHWNKFNVEELPKAPKYDGHKPSDIERLYSLVGCGNSVDLIGWLEGEKYIYGEDGTPMTDKYCGKHSYENGYNRMIDKTINRIKEMMPK